VQLVSYQEQETKCMGKKSPGEAAEQYRPSAGRTLDVQGDGDPFARTERFLVRSAWQHHLPGGRDPESHDQPRLEGISGRTQIGGGESHDIHRFPNPTYKYQKASVWSKAQKLR